MKKSVVIFVVAIFIFSCSSQPKDTGDVIHLRAQAEKELAVANKTAVHGDYETARSLLEECKRKAVLADDWGLIIRCSLSLGNVLFSLGKNDLAFSELEKAVQLAQKHGDRELLSVSRVFYARGNLISGNADPKTVLSEVNSSASNIKNDKLYIAFSWQVKGLAYRAIGSFLEAENAVKQSLAIHEKEKYLDNASYDWYTIASIRSMAGNTQGALDALTAAIRLDRRVENSWGLAANWRAMGDVYRKMGDIQSANDAYMRAKDIYTALGHLKDSAEIDKRMEN
ncbi:MAG: tetratricopeptide repeat protein [Treponema sp.]|jgi:tetratricopeptide (TPR) repeat protein|nr:tetratricopeptide repeat protein [Treponema sp.]